MNTQLNTGFKIWYAVAKIYADKLYLRTERNYKNKINEVGTQTNEEHVVI